MLRAAYEDNSAKLGKSMAGEFLSRFTLLLR